MVLNEFDHDARINVHHVKYPYVQRKQHAFTSYDAGDFL